MQIYTAENIYSVSLLQKGEPPQAALLFGIVVGWLEENQGFGLPALGGFAG